MQQPNCLSKPHSPARLGGLENAAASLDDRGYPEEECWSGYNYPGQSSIAFDGTGPDRVCESPFIRWRSETQHISADSSTLTVKHLSRNGHAGSAQSMASC